MILNVENLMHGFGDRAIFNNVSFRLLAGEHIGLVGANGEGKSTFMNIVTGTLTPDEGKVEWNKHVRVGYLDQHAVLEKGMTIEDVLKSAFSYLFDMEQNINEIYESMADATDDEIAEMMEEIGLPFAYHHFAEGESPAPPFLLFLSPGENTFSADNLAYFSCKQLDIELYTDKKQPELEEQVESVLSQHEIYYTKTETFIDSEELYEVLYEMEV